MLSSFLPLGLCTCCSLSWSTLLLSHQLVPWLTVTEQTCLNLKVAPTEGLPQHGPSSYSSSSRGFSCTNQSCFLRIFCDLPPPRSAQTPEVFRKREKRKEESFLPEPPLARPQPHPPSDLVSAALRGLAGLWDPSQLLVKSHGQLTHTSLCSLGLPLIGDFLLPACLLCSVIQGLCLRGSPGLHLNVCLGLYLSVCLFLSPSGPSSLSTALSPPLPCPSTFSSPIFSPCVSSCPPTSFSLCLSAHPSCAVSGSHSENAPLSLAPTHSEGSSGSLPCLSLGAWVVGAFLRWGPRCGGLPGGRPDRRLSNTLVRLLFI